MPAVLFYVQHLLGIGHLMRARVIAEALAAAGCDVHLVTGGRPSGGCSPRGVRAVQLPPIHVTDAGMKPLRDAGGHPIDDAYREQRRKRLLAEFDSVAPDAVVFETFPFGRRALHFELLPLLERIEATRPRPLVVASVRDILQRRRNPDREREMLGMAQRAFDAVLVHGDRRFIRFDATFPLAPELHMPVHYTGFVVASDVRAPSAEEGARDEVIVSAGGGAVGFALLRAAIDARRRSRFGTLPWRLLVGTNAASDELERLARDAGPGVIVERARADFPALLARAAVSVSQAGYNTVLDVVRSGARPVLVPFAEHGETEQRTRAERLRELGMAIVVEGSEISGAALASAIDEAAAKDDWACWTFDCDGATRSAELIIQMLDEKREPRGPKGVSARYCAAPTTFEVRIRSRAGARVNAWQSLDAEFEQWREAGRHATLWLRDDDACRDSAALQRLLGIAEAAAMPVALAAIPATLEPSLVDAVARSRFATVIQHGYAHRNHAPQDERKMELGLHRAMDDTITELARGLDTLRRSFGPRFVAVLVPPWNRIGGEVVARLPDAGFGGLSTLGPRKARCAAPGLAQCNTHVDLIAWQHTRAFIGIDTAIDRLVAHLRARREGSADPDEPSGLLTHHLAMSDAGWEFAVELVARTREHGAAWLEVASVFGSVDCGAPTSGRSA